MSRTRTGTVIFENVSKRYRLGEFGSLRDTASSLKRAVSHRTVQSEIFALRNVTFRVEPGEAFGLVGPNGAGKTTILKLLSRITSPSSGSITANGRIASLIELGAGFHPELTGRENIYLNGAILGLKRQEITRRFDTIVAFSELQQFIDTPVKRYSSGMYVRLGFAIAAHVDCDIMLVDEVLSVGDSAFRHRSLQRMRELQRSGVTVLFVSHNIHLVRQACRASLLLVKGSVRAIGDTPSVIGQYETHILEQNRQQPCELAGSVDSAGNNALLLGRIEMCGSGNPEYLSSSVAAKLELDYVTNGVVPVGRIDVRIIRDDGTLCCTLDSTNQMQNAIELQVLEGKGTVAISFTALQLTTGTYTAIVQITDPSDSMVIASGQSTPFNVYAPGNGVERGIYVPAATWTRTWLSQEESSTL